MVVSIFISFLDLAVPLFDMLSMKMIFFTDSVEVVTNMMVIHDLLFITFVESRASPFCHIDMKQNHLAFGFTQNRSV